MTDTMTNGHASEAAHTEQHGTRVLRHETLGEAVCAALLEMEAVGKSGTNKRDGYDFRTVDDVMAAVRTPFARHGVWLKPTFGNPRPVQVGFTEEGAAKFDPLFLEVPITLTMVHAHSDQRETISGVGRGRMAGSGNVSLADPRVVGQALSYGMKALLINAFQLAGGDDSADEAARPDPTPPRRRAEPEPADPRTEEARQGVLDAIAGLPQESKDLLREWCRENGVVIARADLEQLEATATLLARLVEADAPTLAAAREHVAAVAEREGPTEEQVEAALAAAHETLAAEQPEVQQEYDIEDDIYPEGEEAPEAAVEAAQEPERHLAAVPDAAPEDGPSPADKLSNDQFAFVLATGGQFDGPEGLEDRDATKAALRYATGLRTKKMHRAGYSLVDQKGAVIVDGREAIDRYLAG